MQTQKPNSRGGGGIIGRPFALHLAAGWLLSLSAPAFSQGSPPVPCPLGCCGSANGTMSAAQASLPHPDDPGKQAEHLALFDLVPLEQATCITAASGDWSAPATWQGGAVPPAGARVVVLPGHDVRYDVVENAALDWVRVQGSLRFATQTDTRLKTEHLIVDPSGTFEVGTPANPIAANRSAEILIDTSGGPISRVEDPHVLGRGFVSHGVTVIHGAVTTPFTTLAGDALAGASFIELSDATVPQGWNAGDILLVAGTSADLAEENSGNLFGAGSTSTAQDADNSRFKDELLEIVSITPVGGKVRVTFKNVTNAAAIAANRTTLLWNHQRPDGDLFDPSELRIHVANLSRNVVIRSSDPTVPAQERGHIMVMHNPNARIAYLQSKDMGRSDKAIRADDPAAIGNFDGTPSTGTNPRGRYGLHLHRVGATDYNGVRAELIGCVVWGVPGWGIVHHDSYALLQGNVVFDVVGAGIVAEDGNEIGDWHGNLVVKATGEPNSDFDDNIIQASGRGDRFDLGFVGSGYWIQGGGAGLELKNNVAVSCNAAGFDIVPKTGLTPLPHDTFPTRLIRDAEVRQALTDAGITQVAINAAPQLPMEGLTVYNSFRGVHTWLYKRDSIDFEHRLLDPPNVAHTGEMIVRDFKFWHVLSGIQNLYSQMVRFEDGLVVGDPQQPFRRKQGNDGQGNNVEGIALSHNSNDGHSHSFDQLRIEGFEYGLQTVHAVRSGGVVVPTAIGRLWNTSFANVDHPFTPNNRPGSPRPYFPIFEAEGNSFDPLPGGADPAASFTVSATRGFGVRLDASASYDPDPHEIVAAGNATLPVYAWDFTGDGQSDAWGREIVWDFGSPGARQVTLTVIDSDGRSAVASRSVQITPLAYPNVLVDSAFNSASGPALDRLRTGASAVSSLDRGVGWLGDNLTNAGGFLRATNVPRLTQVVRDEFATRGEQTLNLRLRQTAASGQPGDVWVTVYGIDGQFDLDQPSTAATAARPVFGSVLPVSITPLIRENVGGVTNASWTTRQLGGDFGPGYEYLAVHIAGSGQNIAGGDVFEIDDVRLTGDAPSGQFAQIDLEQLGNLTQPAIETADSAGGLSTFEGLGTANAKTYLAENSRWIGTVFNGDEGISFRRSDGAPFALEQLDLLARVGNRTYTITGHRADGSTLQGSIAFGGWSDRLKTLVLPGWTNLTRVEFDNGNQDDGRVLLDNLRVAY